jgi:hypothetical protein
VKPCRRVLFAGQSVRRADAAKGAEERSGESDTHFMNEVARGDADLSSERRQPFGAGRQARLLKADENEVRTLGGNLLGP